MRALQVMLVLLVPANPLHELTHVAFARPFASSTSVERSGFAVWANLEWEAGTPVAWIRLAHLAPTLTGVTIACVSAPLLPLYARFVDVVGQATASLVGVPDAAPELSVLVAVSMLVNWLAFTWPSYSDIFPFGGER
ncbi:hypothetical protein [Haloarchaeobius sp. DFWS5]|uniref:hypothetical protein n=1 Tax=Haloarchaeobius sp. DFWS5 TaxID=3446114 RepID=UPI003EBDF29A